MAASSAEAPGGVGGGSACRADWCPKTANMWRTGGDANVMFSAIVGAAENLAGRCGAALRAVAAAAGTREGPPSLLRAPAVWRCAGLQKYAPGGAESQITSAHGVAGARWRGREIRGHDCTRAASL